MIVVLTTVSKKSDALKLARALLKNKLAACVNVVKIESTNYKWKGKLVNGKEFLLVIKSSRNYDAIERFLIKNHSYELPEIIALPIVKGYKKYLSWLSK